MPYDSEPADGMFCPLCRSDVLALTRHHLVPRGLGGSDTSENLVWLCGDGVTGCHGVLTHHNRDGETGRRFDEVANDLIEYVLGIPVYFEHVREAKYDGWLFDYYSEKAA